MKKSKIVVPTAFGELSEPRFDEAITIVSARKVVPIAQARAAERRRAALSISLILLAAAACGGIGAIVANEYLHSSAPSSAAAPVAMPSPQPQTQQPADNSPMPLETRNSTPPSNSEEPAGNHTSGDSQGTTAQADKRSETNKPVEAPAPPDTTKSSSQPAQPAASPSDSSTDNNNSNDPGKLTRKRRVHPVNPTATMIRTKAEEKVRRGTALIQEVLDSLGHP